MRPKIECAGPALEGARTAFRVMQNVGIAIVLLSLVASVILPTAAARVDGQAAGIPTAGDANCDETTDSVDALVILQFDAGLLSTVPCAINGDVTGDGSNDAIDAVLILHFVAGLFPHFV